MSKAQLSEATRSCTAEAAEGERPDPARVAEGADPLFVITTVD